MTDRRLGVYVVDPAEPGDGDPGSYFGEEEVVE